MPADDREIRDCIDSALAIVQEAGLIALEYFRSDMAVHDKRSHGRYDPVTEADRRIEAVIRGRLGERHPGHRIVGEEHGSTGEGRYCWYIDPIDGTRAFISGMPTWGILLGLAVDGRAVGGIMHQPFTGETCVADPVRGSRLLHGGREKPLRTSSRTRLADATLYTTHPSMFPDPLLRERYDRLASCVQLQRWGGDCYALALVAQGWIDLMVEGALAPYDIVALIPIIEQAGGVVTDLAGREPMQGGTVIAAANAGLHAEALAILA